MQQEVNTVNIFLRNVVNFTQSLYSDRASTRWVKWSAPQWVASVRAGGLSSAAPRHYRIRVCKADQSLPAQAPIHVYKYTCRASGKWWSHTPELLYLIEAFFERWGVTLNKHKAQVAQLALRDLTCRCTNGWSHNGQPAAVLMVSRSFIFLLPPAVLLCCEINSHMIKSASVCFSILSRLNNGFIKTACILGCAGDFSLGFCKLLIHDYVVRRCGFGLRFHCQSSYSTRVLKPLYKLRFSVIIF